MELNQLSYQIIGCAMKVHSELGPGLLEKTYEECLHYELVSQGFICFQQLGLPLIYRDMQLELGYRIDLLVQDQVIIEVKAVENLNDVHLAQLLTYLKLSNRRLGLLINFNVEHLKSGIQRVINGFE